MIVSFIKLIVCLYDLITLPIYTIIQKPWLVWHKSGAVRARQLDSRDAGSPWVRLGEAPKHYMDDCLTIDEAIKKSIEFNGRDKPCLAFREIIDEEVEYLSGKPITKYVLSDYKWITCGQFDDRVDSIAKGLILNGVKSRDKVMIFADTSIEWFICAQSILRIGCTVATIYSSLNDEGIIHGVNETEVSHVITSHQLLPKLLRLEKQIPNLTKIIYFYANNRSVKTIENLSQTQSISLIALTELERMGKMVSEGQVVYNMPSEEDIAVLLYTSGSTGVPKGVKITHKNFMKSATAYKQVVEHVMDDLDSHLYIGYLPLAHILELLTETILFIVGIRIGYSTPYTLTDMGTAIRQGDKGDATLLQPTLMAAVPLVLDRIRKGICDKINKKGLIAKKLFEFLVDYKSFWTQKGFETPLMNRLVCHTFRATVGGRLSIMLVGGAPLSQDTQKLIKSCLNVHLLQGYASTETTGAGCIMDPFDDSLGRVGAPLLGTQIKIIDWTEGGYRATDKPNPRGEIVMGSDAISKGYFKLDADTEEAYFRDPNGQMWFRTGDIGEVYPNGTFKIIDRKKDLIKLQFGEYVSLGKIEAELKSNQFVDNICVYGHLYHSYLVALVVPNQLSVTTLANRLKIDYNSYSDLLDDKRIVSYLTNQIQRYGLNAKLNKFEIPLKIRLCSEDWTPDNGLVTAAMKIKRKNIINRYEKDIELMYENSDNNNI